MEKTLKILKVEHPVEDCPLRDRWAHLLIRARLYINWSWMVEINRIQPDVFESHEELARSLPRYQGSRALTFLLDFLRHLEPVVVAYLREPEHLERIGYMVRLVFDVARTEAAYAWSEEFRGPRRDRIQGGGDAPD